MHLGVARVFDGPLRTTAQLYRWIGLKIAHPRRLRRFGLEEHRRNELGQILRAQAVQKVGQGFRQVVFEWRPGSLAIRKKAPVKG